MNGAFDAEAFFPRKLFEAVTELRVEEPERVLQEARLRRRRKRLARNGKLVLVAADHPGRGVTRTGSDSLGMGDRYQYLARILRVLQEPGVDGVMATADVLEELFLVQSLVRQQGGRAFLDDRVLVGCMNRGGLAGAVFEMRDRFTALTPRQLQQLRLDAAKMMVRLDWQNPDSGSTLYDCARALGALERRGLPAFLEPLPVQREDAGYRVLRTAEAFVRTIGIATALGASSRLRWLKIPYVQDYPRVVRATTCPLLMLGGEAADPVGLLEDFASGVAAGANVRGVLVGRNVLFPGEADPALMARAVSEIVHEARPASEAARHLQEPSPALSLS